MIYAIHGTDVKKVRAKASGLVKSLLAKKPDTTHMRITPERYTSGIIEEVIGSQGLFSDKLIIELDALLTLEDVSLVEHFADFKESNNVFILIEEDIEPTILASLKKHAEKIEEHHLSEPEEKAPTLFALADALGGRNKKMLWVEYQKARMNGSVEEEIHGMLFWQTKSMIIASASGEKESGLKPFVYGKSKRYASNFSSKELAGLSSSLITIYHEARRGGPELASSLEQWVLGV